MLKLFSVKDKQKEEAAQKKQGVKQSAGEIRMQKGDFKALIRPKNGIARRIRRACTWREVML